MNFTKRNELPLSTLPKPHNHQTILYHSNFPLSPTSHTNPSAPRNSIRPDSLMTESALQLGVLPITSLFLKFPSLHFFHPYPLLSTTNSLSSSSPITISRAQETVSIHTPAIFPTHNDSPLHSNSQSRATRRRSHFHAYYPEIATHETSIQTRITFLTWRRISSRSSGRISNGSFRVNTGAAGPSSLFSSLLPFPLPFSLSPPPSSPPPPPPSPPSPPPPPPPLTANGPT